MNKHKVVHSLASVHVDTIQLILHGVGNELEDE